jgi:hypothetical protein
MNRTSPCQQDAPTRRLARSNRVIKDLPQWVIRVAIISASNCSSTDFASR